MNILAIYRFSLVSVVLTYSAYWFFPFMYGYFEDAQQEFLSYGGSWSIYYFPTWFYWSLYILWLIGALGMLLMRKLGRLIFLCTVIILMPISILTGFVVQSPPEVFLGYVTTSLEAFVLTLAFFSPIREKFW